MQYYSRVGATGAVFGSVTHGAKGSYAVDLEIWDKTSSSPKPIAIHRKITNLLGAFGLADQFALEVGSAVVGRKLSEGNLHVKDTDSLPKFSIYVDGHLMARNRTNVPVLTGHREIIIAKPGAEGDVPLEFFHVDIQAGKTTTVALSSAGSARAGAASSSVDNAASARESEPRSSSGVASHSQTSLPTPPAVNAGQEANALSISAGALGLRYQQGRGIFGHPVLVYGRRTYTLATKGEFAWALALLSNLPGLTPQIQARLSDVQSELNRATRRRNSFVALSALAAGGVAATVYALLRPNQNVLTAGMVAGIASLSAAIPTRMLQLDSNSRVGADISSVIEEYEKLPGSVRNRAPAKTLFNSTVDFSETQGKDNWYYGFSDTPNGHFQLMHDFNHAYGMGEWWQDYSNWWTAIWADGMSPGSPKHRSNGLSTAVRRFVVPANGVYEVRTYFNRDYDHGTDVVFSFRKNDSTVWSQAVAATDVSLYNKTSTLPCRRGDTLDFVLSEANNLGYGNLSTTIIISRQR